MLRRAKQSAIDIGDMTSFVYVLAWEVYARS